MYYCSINNQRSPDRGDWRRPVVIWDRHGDGRVEAPREEAQPNIDGPHRISRQPSLSCASSAREDSAAPLLLPCHCWLLQRAAARRALDAEERWPTQQVAVARRMPGATPWRWPWRQGTGPTGVEAGGSRVWWWEDTGRRRSLFIPVATTTPRTATANNTALSCAGCRHRWWTSAMTPSRKLLVCLLLCAAVPRAQRGDVDRNQSGAHSYTGTRR